MRPRLYDSWRDNALLARLWHTGSAAHLGVSQLLGSFSYEAVNNDRKHPPDERSIDIRMRAKAWSFDIVTWIMMIVPPLVGMFDAVNSRTHAIVMVAVYGLLAIALLIKAALLIFYERNL